MVKLLLIVGIVLQTVGSLLIGIPLFKKLYWFDTSAAMMTDERGRWPKLVKVGFWIYISGYLPLLIGTGLSP